MENNAEAPAPSKRGGVSVPCHMQLLFIGRTICQIKIDQRLIGDTGILRLRLEIVDGIAVDIDGDLFFQLFRKRV